VSVGSEKSFRQEPVMISPMRGIVTLVASWAGGKVDAAREGLEKILADHPENENARAALRALDSGELPACPGLLEGV